MHEVFKGGGVLVMSVKIHVFENETSAQKTAWRKKSTRWNASVCLIIGCLKCVYLFFCIFSSLFLNHRCENELFLSWLLLQKTCWLLKLCYNPIRGTWRLTVSGENKNGNLSPFFRSRKMRSKLRRGGFLIKDVSALWGCLWKPK